jgi:hypothetical protein
MMRLTRRGFLVLGGAVGAAGVGVVAALFGRDRPSQAHAGHAAPTSTTVAHREAAGAASVTAARYRWSDPDAWSDGVPGPKQVAVVTKSILLDVDVEVAGVVVERGAQLIFDPAASHRLKSSGNVVVRGRLVMHPASAAIDHRLVVTGAEESAFVGGGMDVLASDVGVWVMGSGRLDLAGTPKLAWTRVTGAVEKGASTVTLEADPAGWRPGDEVVLTPTLDPQATDHFAAFDSARIRAISGRAVTLDRATRFAHPSVDLGDRRLLTAELVNLTRNVAIEGVPGRRAHIFIRSNRPQSLKWTGIRHVGPRKASRSDANGTLTASVKGRYGVHIHMCGNGSRGSLVEGTVVRDAGSHAYVAHESHGVRFRDCVAFDVVEDAYWWDGPPGTMTGGATDPGTISDDIAYERCVAALVRWEPAYEGYGLSGFRLGRGTRNICRNCVAVGVQGNVNASGFQWPENEEGPGVWDFRDNVAHNNARHGIFWWQATIRHHEVLDFAAYRNGGSGIMNGSYGDNNHFERCRLVQNAEAQFFGWAVSGQLEPSDPNSRGDPTPQHLLDSVLDSGGHSDFACVLAGRAVVPSTSTGEIKGNVFRGARKACVAISYDFHDYGPSPARWQLHGNTYEGNPYWFDSSSHESTSVITEAGELHRSDHPAGAENAAWNAKVT